MLRLLFRPTTSPTFLYLLLIHSTILSLYELLEFSETKSRRGPRLDSPRLGPRQSISGPSRESRAARCLFASALASASNKSFCNLIA